MSQDNLYEFKNQTMTTRSEKLKQKLHQKLVKTQREVSTSQALSCSRFLYQQHLQSLLYDFP